MADVASLAAAISGVASAGAELERRADEERAACEALAAAAEASSREQARIQNQLARVEADLIDTECDTSDLTHVLAFRKAQLAGTRAQIIQHKVAIDSATTTALLMLEAFESQAVSFQARVGADACEARKSAADARAQAADLKLTALKQEATSLRQVHAAQVETVKQLEQEVATAEQALTDLRLQLASVEAEYQQLNAEKESLQRALSQAPVPSPVAARSTDGTGSSRAGSSAHAPEGTGGNTQQAHGVLLKESRERQEQLRQELRQAQAGAAQARSSCAVLQAELAGMQAEHDRLVSNAHLQQQYQQHQQYQVPAGGPHHMQGTRVLLAAAQPYPGTSSVKTGRHMPGGNQYAGATAGTWANHGPHNTHGPAPSSATGQHGHAATTGHGYHHSSSRVPWSAAADGQGLAQGQQPGAEAGGNNNMYIVELPDSDEEEQVHRDERGASGTARTAHAHTEQGFQGGMGAGWAAADNQGRPGHMPHAKSTTQHAGPGQQGQNGQMPPQQQGVSCAVRETVINRQVRQSPHTVMQHTVTVTEVMQQQPNSGYSAGAGSSLSPAKPSGPVSGAADTAATAAKPKKAKAPKHVGSVNSNQGPSRGTTTAPPDVSAATTMAGAVPSNGMHGAQGKPPYTAHRDTGMHQGPTVAGYGAHQQVHASSHAPVYQAPQAYINAYPAAPAAMTSAAASRHTQNSSVPVFQPQIALTPAYQANTAPGPVPVYQPATDANQQPPPLLHKPAPTSRWQGMPQRSAPGHMDGPAQTPSMAVQAAGHHLSYPQRPPAGAGTAVAYAGIRAEVGGGSAALASGGIGASTPAPQMVTHGTSSPQFARAYTPVAQDTAAHAGSAAMPPAATTSSAMHIGLPGQELPSWRAARQLHPTATGAAAASVPQWQGNSGMSSWQAGIMQAATAAANPVGGVANTGTRTTPAPLTQAAGSAPYLGTAAGLGSNIGTRAAPPPVVMTNVLGGSRGGRSATGIGHPAAPPAPVNEPAAVEVFSVEDTGEAPSVREALQAAAGGSARGGRGRGRGGRQTTAAGKRSGGAVQDQQAGAGTQAKGAGGGGARMKRTKAQASNEKAGQVDAFGGSTGWSGFL